MMLKSPPGSQSLTGAIEGCQSWWEGESSAVYEGVNGISSLQQPSSHRGLSGLSRLNPDLSYEAQTMQAAKAQDTSARLSPTWPKCRTSDPQEMAAIHQDVAQLGETILDKAGVVPDRVVHQNQVCTSRSREGLAPALGTGQKLIQIATFG